MSRSRAGPGQIDAPPARAQPIRPSLALRTPLARASSLGRASSGTDALRFVARARPGVPARDSDGAPRRRARGAGDAPARRCTALIPRAAANRVCGRCTVTYWVEMSWAALDPAGVRARPEALEDTGRTPTQESQNSSSLDSYLRS